MTHREPLSLVDHAWLRMERPTNPMMITSLIELDQRLTVDALTDVIRKRLLPHPRFTQVVKDRMWTPDPHFALASHLHRIALPAPADARTLANLVSDLMSTALDRARPLWQVHLVEDYAGGSAIIVRIHHSVADGIALVRLLMALTDHTATAEAPAVGPRPQRGSRVIAGARTLAHILALPPDPDTVIHGPLGVRKCAAWSQPAALAPIRDAARRTGGTINDVLLAALTGALREYLLSHGGLPHSEIRALVPVNLRRVVGGGEAGNRFGLVYLSLPIGCATPEERLREARRRMAAIKASPEAMLAFGVLGAMGVASAALENVGIELFTRKASAVVTSVPGPTEPVRLAGRTIRSLAVWAPASGGVGLTLSLLSYRGQVRLGVAADQGLIGDPWSIAEAFDGELARLTAKRSARTPRPVSAEAPAPA